MPKIKTRRAAAKRFRITRTGKIMRHHSKMRHLLECKSPKKRRSLRQAGPVSRADKARVKIMLPGGSNPWSG